MVYTRRETIMHRRELARRRKLEKARRARHTGNYATHAVLRGREHLYVKHHGLMHTPGLAWGLIIILILLGILFLLFVI